MQDAKFGFRKLTSQNFPILGANASASAQQLNIELKNFTQNEVMSALRVRIRGNIVVAGAGPGAATGRDNPEGLLTNFILRSSPDLGINLVDNVSARGLRTMNLYERGYDIKAAAVPDLAGTYAVAWDYLVNFRKPSAIKPVEYSLPLGFFSSVLLQLTFGTRDQLFSGGVNTWDVSGLTVEIWAKYDRNVAGTFHATCFNERSFQAITASQGDFPMQNMPVGFLYTDFLLRTERNLALVNDILNSFTLQSAGRIWLPQGDNNALEIQAEDREALVDPTASLTGLYYLNALKDGFITNAVDSLDSQLDLKADVTSGAGSQFLVLVSKRSIPNALTVQPIAAATAAPGA